MWQIYVEYSTKHNNECRAKPGSWSRSELCESDYTRNMPVGHRAFYDAGNLFRPVVCYNEAQYISKDNIR